MPSFAIPAPAGQKNTLKQTNTLWVNEVFLSVQGESTHQGWPCVFVRLAGCSLRCVWCDTPYSFHEGTYQSFDTLSQKIQEYACPRIEITGGEPLLQKNIFPFMNLLLEKGYTVLLETSGAVDISPVPDRVIKIMDIKCPGSGEVDRNLWSNLDYLQSHDEVKFVIADRKDYDWAKEILYKHHLWNRCAAVLFSCVFEILSQKTLAEWILKDKLPVRLNLQLHKYIWGPAVRGV